MKRIVVLCDGTWNETDDATPTNVVRLAQALAPRDAGGTDQIPVYIDGVGTGEGITWISRFLDKKLGGALGWGLTANVVEAYRNLVFLYEPGDALYIFGFSRGAYTARSLAGFLRSTGILPRTALHKIPRAVRRYRTTGRRQTHPRTEASHAFRAAEMESRVATSSEEQEWRAANGVAPAPLLQIAYMGVWDTVGALGVPRFVPLLHRVTSQHHRFHDTSLSRMVSAARHAVALDERRAAFAPTLWDNLGALHAEAADHPYRQEYFPGDHGSVGGGGDVRDLSAIALDWIMEGAEAQGLAFDPAARAAIRAEQHPLGPLTSSTEPRRGFINGIMALMPKRDRNGPDRLEDVHLSARIRFAAETKSDAARPYRPRSLRKVAPALTAWARAWDGDGGTETA